jgi:hypothetical protein
MINRQSLSGRGKTGTGTPGIYRAALPATAGKSGLEELETSSRCFEFYASR